MLAIAGCGFDEAQKEAEEVVETTFELVKKGEFEAVPHYYSEDFFRETTTTELIDSLLLVDKEFGNLESYKLADAEVTKEYASGKGTYVKLLYETQYTYYESTEVYFVKKEAGSFEYKIDGVNFYPHIEE